MFSDEDVKKSTVREVDAHGRLLRAGFWWWEPRRRTHRLLHAVYVGSIVFAVFGTVAAIFAFVASFTTLGLVLTALSAGLIAIATWIKRKGPFYAAFRRAVVFCDDGTILMENPEQKLRHIKDFRSDLGPIRKGLADITTIEFKPAGRTRFGGVTYDAFCIYAYFSDGQEGLLGYDITDERVARIVVVKLNQALRDMRESIASRAVQRPQVVN